MSARYTYLLPLLLLLLPREDFARSKKTDSLEQVLRVQAEDTGTAGTLNELAYALWANGKLDSSLYYAGKARDLSTKLLFEKGEARSRYIQGLAYSSKSNYPEALKQLGLSLATWVRLGDKAGESDCYNSIGIAYKQQGNFPQALDYYFKALKIQEEIGKKRGMAGSLHNIGLVLKEQGSFEQAKIYLLRALALNKELGNKSWMINNYIGLGNLYQQQDDLVNGKDYFMKALELAQAEHKQATLPTIYNSLATICMKSDKWDEALDHLTLALRIKKQSETKNDIADIYVQLCSVLLHLHRNTTAKAYIDTGLAISLSTGQKMWTKMCYEKLGEYYEQEGDYGRSLENFKKYVVYRDSLVNEENTKKTVQAEMQYEFDKKESQAKAEQDKKNTVARIIIYSITSGLLLVMLLALFIFRSYRQKQKVNVIITQQKKEVEKQKLLVEVKQKEILDSIHYAKRIQKSLLPTARYLARVLEGP